MNLVGLGGRNDERLLHVLRRCYAQRPHKILHPTKPTQSTSQPVSMPLTLTARGGGGDPLPLPLDQLLTTH